MTHPRLRLSHHIPTSSFRFPSQLMVFFHPSHTHTLAHRLSSTLLLFHPGSSPYFPFPDYSQLTSIFSRSLSLPPPPTPEPILFLPLPFRNVELSPLPPTELIADHNLVPQAVLTPNGPIVVLLPASVVGASAARLAEAAAVSITPPSPSRADERRPSGDGGAIGQTLPATSAAPLPATHATIAPCASPTQASPDQSGLSTA